MKRFTLTAEDHALAEQARRLIGQRQKENWHAVSAVLKTKSGKIFEGLHLEAYVGRIAVCAEATAIGAAAVQGDTAIDTIVAVYKTGKVISPCGMCRELISDYSPGAMVILQDENGLFKTPVRELLPLKYAREPYT
jgi:cytidine deaminase